VTVAAARLLIVDDESAQMRRVCDTLNLEATPPMVSAPPAGSGGTASRRVRPAVDRLMMPEMDGFA